MSEARSEPEAWAEVDGRVPLHKILTGLMILLRLVPVVISVSLCLDEWYLPTM
jgi:hypothetical protein